MKLFPDWLLSAISDGSGNTSTGRLIAVSIAATGVCLPELVWAFISILSMKLVEVPTSLIGFMAAAGSLAGSLYAITKAHE